MSKALTPLEALEELRFKGLTEEYRNKCCDIVETALKEYELMKEIRVTARFDLAQVNKEHKALEIIKEKQVNVFIFLHSGDLETYNDIVEDNRKLTETEYDLLKEVLL